MCPVLPTDKQNKVRMFLSKKYCSSGSRTLFVLTSTKIEVMINFGTASGSFGKAKNYAVAADMKMTDLGKYSSSYGFLGIAFNMIDSKNYDIAYVR